MQSVETLAEFIRSHNDGDKFFTLEPTEEGRDTKVAGCQSNHLTAKLSTSVRGDPMSVECMDESSNPWKTGNTHCDSVCVEPFEHQFRFKEDDIQVSKQFTRDRKPVQNPPELLGYWWGRNDPTIAVDRCRRLQQDHRLGFNAACWIQAGFK